MSRIEGLEQLKERLRSFEDTVTESVAAAIEDEVRVMRDEVAQTVPVDTGRGRDALLDPSALRVVKSPSGGQRVVYGLDSLKLGRQAFHLFFVEFGTKGYEKGQERRAGVRKSNGAWHFTSKKAPRDDARFEYRESVGVDGKIRLERRLIDRQRWQRMKRFVPARPAQPFWRPAEANLWRRLQRRLDLARIVATARSAAGLADKS